MGRSVNAGFAQGITYPLVTYTFVVSRRIPAGCPHARSAQFCRICTTTGPWHL